MLTSDAKLDISIADSYALMEIAHRSALLGFQGRQPYQPLVDNYSIALRRLQSSCVTLLVGEQIVGRAATLRPMSSLISDVNHNAYEAACHMPNLEQGQDLTIDVLVLSALRRLVAASLEEVLQYVEPGVHGVRIQHEDHDAMFLPDKWQAFPEAAGFFRALRAHAGMDPERWSPNIYVSTYEVHRLPQRLLSIPLNPRVMKRKSK